MSDEDNVIEGETVDNLPAVIERATYESSKPKAEGTRPASLPGRDWSTYSRPERRCTAHSTRTGEPCKNAAIKGHNVCRFHGGAAPQIKQAARTRLENAADRMAMELLGFALAAETDSLRLTAIRDVLDRVGITKPQEVALSQGNPKPWEEVYEGIAGVSREESRARRGYAGNAGSTPEGNVSTSNTTEYADLAPEYVPRDDISPTYQHRADPRAKDVDAFLADAPAPQAPPTTRGSERDAGPRSAPVQHVVGDAALEVAGQLTREQLAIESPHKRYPRP